MAQGTTPLFQPCPEREQLLKKAASARREHDELKRKADRVIGTEEYRVVIESARAALQTAEAAMNEYLDHVREHGC